MRKILIWTLGCLLSFNVCMAEIGYFSTDQEHYKNFPKEEISNFKKLGTCTPTRFKPKDQQVTKAILYGKTKNGLCHYYEENPKGKVNCLWPMPVVVGLSSTILNGAEYALEDPPQTDLFVERLTQFIELIQVADDYCTVTK